MCKLTWFGSVLLTLVVCATSVSHAQQVRYEYAGPLDGLQTVPLSDIISARPTHRVAGLKPVKKLPPAYPRVSSAAVGRITGVSPFSPPKQTAGRITEQRFTSRRPIQAIRPALPQEVPTPTFSGPLTKSTSLPAATGHGHIRSQIESTQYGYSGALTNPRNQPVETNYVPAQDASAQYGYSRALTNPRNQPVETNYVPAQDASAQYGYSGALTDPRTPPVETNYVLGQDASAQYGYSGALTDPRGYQAGYIPRQEDPTRFGYRDGKAFGFENTRLYNPLEGPRLDLQGAPTVDFGEPGCDEWANFARIRDLEYDTPCGGLKAKPGHLGIPWLGSEDDCDQTIPLRKKRRCGDRRDHTEKVCETCGSCPTCGR